VARHLDPLYKAWKAIRQRCRNPRCREYRYYGGRGIRVCDRWNSFENFAADMLGHPGKGWSIDRIDGDGDYERDNCWWAPPGPHQSRNRRYCKLTEESAAYICQHYIKGSGFHNRGNSAALAEQFGVHRTLIPLVAKRMLWA